MYVIGLAALIVITFAIACGEPERTTPLPTYTPYPTYTPLPTYTPYPTYTPLPMYTPLPTATALPTPVPTATPTPTATLTPLPPVVEPDISQIWKEAELFGLLHALKDRPDATQEKYSGQYVVISQRIATGIFGGSLNSFYLEGKYAHAQPLERKFSIVCTIDPVEDRHLPVLAELKSIQESISSTRPYVQIEGTIRHMRLTEGGLELFIILDGCDVSAIGQRLISTDADGEAHKHRARDDTNERQVAYTRI